MISPSTAAIIILAAFLSLSAVAFALFLKIVERFEEREMAGDPRPGDEP